MSTQSDTPETDAALMDALAAFRAGDSLPVLTVMVKHARKLERERDEIKREIADLIAQKKIDDAIRNKMQEIRTVINENFSQPPVKKLSKPLLVTPSQPTRLQHFWQWCKG